jgi:phage baseplate assembly protein W
MSTDFYGNGISYPVQLGTSGGLRASSGIQKIEESIRIILSTQYGERLMRPTFGCNLKSLVFAPNNEETANLARYYVTDGLKRWEPRIDVLDVQVKNDNQQAQLLISIQYRLHATQQVNTMLFSFPLEAV